MTKYGKWPITVFLVLWVCQGTTYAADSTDSAELGKRYLDPIHGFSLCPPVDTERQREFSAARLVSWSRRDPNTGAILWTLSVHRAVESRTDLNLSLYAKSLAEKLKKEEGFKVDSVEVAPVGDKAAIWLRGETGGVKMWQQQVWILTRPGNFLIVMISGQLDQAGMLQDLAGQVLGTLQILDPQQFRQHQMENIERGIQMLSSLNDAKFAQALTPEAQWYVLKLKDKPIGFRRVVEEAITFEKKPGYRVQMWVLMEVPEFAARLSKQDMFITLDRMFERWVKHLQIGSDDDTAQLVDEMGLRQNDKIACTLSENDRMNNFSKDVPESIDPNGERRDFYLPNVVGMLLPRLVDLKTPSSYSFAVYNAEKNDFDMRTFTVEHPEAVRINGKMTQAIRLADQASPVDDPATLWVDSKGQLLRLETPDGFAMEPCSQAEINRLFPKAQAIIKALGQ